VSHFNSQKDLEKFQDILLYQGTETKLLIVIYLLSLLLLRITSSLHPTD